MMSTSARLARSAGVVGTAGRSAAAAGLSARRSTSHRPLAPHWTAVPAALHTAHTSIRTSERASWRSPSSSSSSALLAAALASLSLLLLGPSLAHAAPAADPSADDADQDPALRHTRLPAARLSIETLSNDYKDVPLTLLERARVRDLRAWLQREVMAASDPAGAEERAYLERWALHDDWALLRYLRAHKHAVAPAAAGLMATIRWRMAERVDDIRVDEFADDYRAGNMYVSTECDPVGRSIVINRKNTDDNPAHKWDQNAYRREMRSLVYTLERAIRTMEDRVTSGEIDPAKIDYKWIMLIDMSGYNRRSATPFHVTKSLIDVLRHHYPERSHTPHSRGEGARQRISQLTMRRQLLTTVGVTLCAVLFSLMFSLHCAVIIEAPWLLRTLVQPLMLVVDRVTRNKIVFLPDRTSETTLQMLSLVVGSLDRVPYESGVVGAATVFDPEAYIQHDPLSEPRPTQPRVTSGSHSDNHVSIHGDREQHLQTAADRRQEGAGGKRAWWAVWK